MDRITIHGGRQFAKKAMMLAKMKEWCKQNPGKKALIAGTTTPSQMLTYYPGAKAFIYSQVKSPLEPTVAIDEFSRDWYETAFVRDAIAISRQALKTKTPEIETIYYDDDLPDSDWSQDKNRQ